MAERILSVFIDESGDFGPHLAGKAGFSFFGEKEAEQKEDGEHSMPSSFSSASCFSFSFFKDPPFPLLHDLLFFLLKNKRKRR